MSEPITETIGVDLGDRYSACCVLDQVTGEELESGRIRTTPEAFARFFGPRNSARVVMEVGTHSPWASRVVAASCAQTYVANARELRFIYMNNRRAGTEAASESDHSGLYCADAPDAERGLIPCVSGFLAILSCRLRTSRRSAVGQDTEVRPNPIRRA